MRCMCVSYRARSYDWPVARAAAQVAVQSVAQLLTCGRGLARSLRLGQCCVARHGNARGTEAAVGMETINSTHVMSLHDKALTANVAEACAVA